MSKKSRRPSRKKEEQPIDRPFDRKIWARAEEISAAYGFLVQPNEQLHYMARGLECPMVLADGPTPEACVASIREGLTVAVATMLEAGETPPSPTDESVRTEQINVRVSPEEKMLIDQAARRRGFRAVSDFVRSATLAGV